MLKAFYRSASLRTAAAMGVGGIGFSLGSLLLARALPTQEYGIVALVLGIVAVAGLTAPLGLDQVAARRGIRLDAPWRRAALGACVLTALAAAAAAALVYHLSASVVVSVAVMSLALGIAQAAGGHFQGQQHLRTAVWVVQLLNGALAVIAIVAVALGLNSASTVCALVAAVVVLAAIAIWWLVRRHEVPGSSGQPTAWGLRWEAISLLVVQACGAAFMQLERLLLGPIVGLHDLAVYSVLAALVSSPFRLLQAAVQFTLIPTLRVAGDARARRAKVAREGALVFVTIAAGSVAIWVLAPPLARWFVAGRYTLSHALIAATLISGFIKVLSGFVTAVVVSCAEERRLRILSLVCWGSIGISVGGAFFAAPWGLVGVIYGIAAGWLIRCVFTAWLALPYLRETRECGARLPREVSLRPSSSR